MSEGIFTTSNERYDMYDKEAQRREAEEISDLEAQWFHGFPKVVEVVNVVTDDDIVGEMCSCGTDVVAPGEVCDYCGTIAPCECGSDDCFWCAPAVDMYADYCACGETGYTTCICVNKRTSTTSDGIPF